MKNSKTQRKNIEPEQLLIIFEASHHTHQPIPSTSVATLVFFSNDCRVSTSATQNNAARSGTRRRTTKTHYVYTAGYTQDVARSGTRHARRGKTGSHIRRPGFDASLFLSLLHRRVNIVRFVVPTLLPKL